MFCTHYALLTHRFLIFSRLIFELHAMANLQDTLKQTLFDSGIPNDSPLLDYLDWAGIRTKNSLAVFFPDHDKIEQWINRFSTKTTFGTPEKEIYFPEEDRRRGLLVCFIATWTICKKDFETQVMNSIFPLVPAPLQFRRPYLPPHLLPTTRYPRLGPRESTNNSSPTTRTTLATQGHSRRRSSLEPRKW